MTQDDDWLMGIDAAKMEKFRLNLARLYQTTTGAALGLSDCPCCLILPSSVLFCRSDVYRWLELR